MDSRSIVVGSGGRHFIKQPGAPMRVASPMECAVSALDEDNRDTLNRFFEASEMSKGNMLVVVEGGMPRGRYAHYADKVSVSRYREYEVGGYRFILKHLMGEKTRGWAEYLARMEGERTHYNFLDWGAELINTNNRDMAMGAAIAALRTLSWHLKDSYRHYERWCGDQERRAQAARQAVAEHKPNLTHNREG